MITDKRCPNCNASYEIAWEDNESQYFEDVESTDDDHDDYDKEEYPQYCPFCGSHESYDGSL